MLGGELGKYEFKCETICYLQLYTLGRGGGHALGARPKYAQNMRKYALKYAQNMRNIQKP